MKKFFPSKLKKGDLIGLVTPGSPVTEKQLGEAVTKLEKMGFRTYYMDSVLDEYGYLAGSDENRAGELMHMFTRREVDAIMCVRGGYGSIRILDFLDYELIRQNPKIFIGYSDITAIITAIYQQAGLVAFHGMMGESAFNDFAVDSFRKILVFPTDRYKYPYEREKNTGNNPEFDIYTISPGEAEGVLIGGNISVLDSMTGSRFEPNFENKIVYLEEIEEKTYRVDKMLFHLLSATNLKQAAGIVMGVFKECNINDKPSLSLQEAITGLLKPLQIPVVYGMPFGHIDTMLTIPTGVMARMDAGKKSLELTERAVV